jgi:hypothetical protein
MKICFSILFFLFSISCTFGITILNHCLVDSSCSTKEYCDKDLLNPIGKCKIGDPEGSICLRNRKCESKRCEFFKCKKRISIKDSLCKTSADCPEDQYCDDVPDKEDKLMQCVDRKCIGFCRKDSQCLSDKCHLFSCVRKKDC